jgi:hypothetical protein
MKTSSIYHDAINHFGAEKQKQKAVEELTELSLVIQHIGDDKVQYLDLVQEVADVEIMLEQLKIMYKIPNHVFQGIKDDKLQRLEERMSK